MRDPVLARPRRTDDTAAVVGALTVGAVVVHAAVTHAFSWAHPAGFLLGLALLAVGGRGRVSAWVLGTTGAAVGLVLTAVGVGLSPHVVGGRVVTAVAAIALVVGGLTLVVVGIRRAVAQWSWPGRVIGVILAVAALGTTVWLLAPPIAATNVPRPGIDRTPADLGLDATSVTLATSDGVELAAWWIPATGNAAVVVLHGAGSTRSDVLDQAAVLVEHGYGTLIVDARGHGESGGTAMDFGWYGDADIAAATDFLLERPDVDAGRIGLVGMSMGGEEAIGATATNDAIRAVVADGATGRSAADTRWLSDVYGWRGTLQEGFERAQHWFTDYLTETGPPTSLDDAVAGSDGTQYLLVAAGKVADEQHVATRLQALAPDRVAVWTAEGAGHTGAFETAHDEWVERVTSFLDRALGTG